jgi:hypothetical protein
MFKQNKHGDSVCNKCHGDIYSCECPLLHSRKCLDDRIRVQGIEEVHRLIQHLGLDDTHTLIERETINRAEKAEADLEAALAYIRGCPVHGNAACPEEYMLNTDGIPHIAYSSIWKESFCCGRRPPRPILTTEER